MFFLHGYFDILCRDKLPLKCAYFHERDFVLYIKTIFSKLKIKTSTLPSCFFNAQSANDLKSGHLEAYKLYGYFRNTLTFIKYKDSFV